MTKVSGTTLNTFIPVIPYQASVVKLVRQEWNYARGNLEILLSGSYGSAKSILIAHLIITHCLIYPKASALLARKALPDLKETIFNEVVQHLEGSDLVEGVDYKINHSRAAIKFANGSKISSISWADKKYKKGRSRNISFLAFEELTENTEEDKQAFMELKARLRRLPHVKENVLIAATNPDAPSHWVYKYFFIQASETKYVFKSITKDNPFLDKIYVDQLMRDLDPKSIQRYIYGEWVELEKDQVYYNYSQERNYRTEFVSKTNVLRISHDFNIGKGKPMSACVAELQGEEYHFFKSFHVEGARTKDIMEEIANSGLLDQYEKILVYGDASGRSNDTRSIKTDYDIIEKFLSNYVRKDGRQVDYEMRVPMSNPPIRKRHNLMNALCENDNKEVRLIVYDEWMDEGMRLTSFEMGGFLTEDDKLPQQHVTTAMGYMAHYDKYRHREEYETGGTRIL